MLKSERAGDVQFRNRSFPKPFKHHLRARPCTGGQADANRLTKDGRARAFNIWQGRASPTRLETCETQDNFLRLEIQVKTSSSSSSPRFTSRALTSLHFAHISTSRLQFFLNLPLLASRLLGRDLLLYFTCCKQIRLVPCCLG